MEVRERPLLALDRREGIEPPPLSPERSTHRRRRNRDQDQAPRALEETVARGPRRGVTAMSCAHDGAESVPHNGAAQHAPCRPSTSRDRQPDESMNRARSATITPAASITNHASRPSGSHYLTSGGSRNRCFRSDVKEYCGIAKRLKQSGWTRSRHLSGNSRAPGDAGSPTHGLRVGVAGGRSTAVPR
jgi:hypothetical protein